MFTQLQFIGHLLDTTATMNDVDVRDSLTEELEWLTVVFPNCHSFRWLQFWSCIFTANSGCLSDDALRKWDDTLVTFRFFLSSLSPLPPSDTVPTACLNKLRWGCMRVTWSPSRPGLSPNVPKSGPSCQRTFCSPSLSWVSHLLFVFPVIVTVCSKKLPTTQKQFAFPTNELRVLVIPSLIMSLACHVRRRSHLCSLRAPDCAKFGCLDLLWLSHHLLVFESLP